MVFLPNQMGYVYLDEKPHKRAFHIRTDIAAITGNKISSLSFLRTLTQAPIILNVFDILPKNPVFTIYHP